MTYLTQADISLAIAARRGLRHSYDWHQAAWQAFPGRDGVPRDYLTRLDRYPHGFRLLIVSPVEPVRPDWCPENAESWKTKSIPEAYFTHARYSFQLCANPTKKVSKELPGGGLAKNGQRVPLTRREELVEWIHRKGTQGGFTVDESTLRTAPRGCERFEKKGQSGLHHAVEFQGVLSVTDPVWFRESFLRGIGSAKAFGFGLLMIVPIS